MLPRTSPLTSLWWFFPPALSIPCSKSSSNSLFQDEKAMGALEVPTGSSRHPFPKFLISLLPQFTGPQTQILKTSDKLGTSAFVFAGPQPGMPLPQVSTMPCHSPPLSFHSNVTVFSETSEIELLFPCSSPPLQPTSLSDTELTCFSPLMWTLGPHCYVHRT